ncbi:MAG: hypothetical protein ACI9G1_004079 [Pirellulaceae bacterium]|jgi:hypothetical protein
MICRRAIVLAFLFANFAFSGCAQWKMPDSAANLLPSPRMSTDAVVLEIAFVRLADSRADEELRMWDEIDQQHLPTDKRKALAEHGLRAGLTVQLPALLQKLLKRQKSGQKLAAVDGTFTEDEVIVQHRKIQIPTGRKRVIDSSLTQEELTISTHSAGDPNDSGEPPNQKTFKLAKCRFGVRTFPQGDGTVQLEITPEIEHGQKRQRYVARQGTFVLDNSCDSFEIDTLKFQAKLAPGQTLLIAPTPDQKGLGKSFFIDQIGEHSQHRVLLIRLAQTQYDSLFQSENLSAPIVTPAEY